MRREGEKLLRHLCNWFFGPFIGGLGLGVAEGGRRKSDGPWIKDRNPKKKGEIEVREREVRFKKFFGRILRFVAHDELVDG